MGKYLIISGIILLFNCDKKPPQSSSPQEPNNPVIPPATLKENNNDPQYWKDKLDDMMYDTFRAGMDGESYSNYESKCLLRLGYRVKAKHPDLNLYDLKFFVKCYDKFDKIIKQAIDKIIAFHKEFGIYSNNFSIKVGDLNKFISSISESTLSEITKLLGDKIAKNINEQLKKNFNGFFTAKTCDIKFDLKKLQNVFKKINEKHSCHLECNDNSIYDIQNSVKQFTELDSFNNHGYHRIYYYSRDGVNFSQITEVLPEVKSGNKYEIVKFDPHETDGFITCIITDNVGKYYILDNGDIDYEPSTIKFLQSVYFAKGAFIGK